jgi:ABC-type sugar transport system ATPase subunit
MKIVLDQVEKTFDNFRAVHGVSLEIGSGELVALLGPSGSGKTTILRMVAGLEYTDGGHIFFGDQDATDIPVRERGVGFVFQHYALFPHMTVAQNIGFGMKVSKVRRSKAEIAAGRRTPAADAARRPRRPVSACRFPAASASAWRSPARSPSTRRCCCSTSPSARSTPMCAATCAAGCARSTTNSASPPSS